MFLLPHGQAALTEVKAGLYPNSTSHRTRSPPTFQMPGSWHFQALRQVHEPSMYPSVQVTLGIVSSKSPLHHQLTLMCACYRAGAVVWCLTQANSLNPSYCDTDTTVIIPITQRTRRSSGVACHKPHSWQGAEPALTPGLSSSKSQTPSPPPWLSTSPVI